MAKKPLMTAAESKTVGWDGEMLDNFPHSAVLVVASRYQLIRLYRFLREAQTPDEVEFVQKLITKLEETYPIEKVEKLQPIGQPEPEVKPSSNLQKVLGHLLKSMADNPPTEE